MKTRKQLPVGFFRCKKHGVHFSSECPTCKTEKSRKEKGLCLATLWHGPGHQSHTYCQVEEPHKVHKAIYGSYEQEMEWKKKKAFTGYFDDPVEFRIGKTMKRLPLIKALLKAFPNIHSIAPGEEFGWNPNCIFLGDAAEGGTIDGEAACNYYGFDIDPKETVWVLGVHRKLRDFLDERGWYVECQDPGTYMAWEK